MFKGKGCRQADSLARHLAQGYRPNRERIVRQGAAIPVGRGEALPIEHRVRADALGDDQPDEQAGQRAQQVGQRLMPGFEEAGRVFLCEHDQQQQRSLILHSLDERYDILRRHVSRNAVGGGDDISAVLADGFNHVPHHLLKLIRFDPW